MDTNMEAHAIRLAVHLDAGHGVKVSDPTRTAWDLKNASPRARQILTAAADLAGVNVTITKVGDEARANLEVTG
jgi:hypothetical protein